MDERLYRAERAKQLLEDPILKEAFDTFESHFIEEMLKADATDEQRRIAADRANAFRAIRGMLELEVNNAGKQAERQEIENLP